MPQASRLKAEVNGLGGRFLDLLFPARCVNCKQVKRPLCDACCATIQRISTPTCARCGYPLFHARAKCSECLAHPLTIHRIRSVVWHEGAARQAVHALKYARRRDVAPLLANFLASDLETFNVRFDLVTSVPLHPTRELERGYNQAELLAEKVAHAHNLPYRRAVKRIRATADQVGMNGQARRANVANAFQAEPSQVANKIVLVIDDVCTTGATLDACATALVQAHACAVYGMTLARPRAFHS